MEYSFTLKYRLHERERSDQALVDRLFESGCDDALLGIGKAGRPGWHFLATPRVANGLLKARSPTSETHLIKRNR